MFLFSLSDLSPAVPQRAVGAERCKWCVSVEEGGRRGGGGVAEGSQHEATPLMNPSHNWDQRELAVRPPVLSRARSKSQRPQIAPLLPFLGPSTGSGHRPTIKPRLGVQSQPLIHPSTFGPCGTNRLMPSSGQARRSLVREEKKHQQQLCKRCVQYAKAATSGRWLNG